MKIIKKGGTMIKIKITIYTIFFMIFISFASFGNYYVDFDNYNNGNWDGNLLGKLFYFTIHINNNNFKYKTIKLFPGDILPYFNYWSLKKATGINRNGQIQNIPNDSTTVFLPKIRKWTFDISNMKTVDINMGCRLQEKVFTTPNKPIYVKIGNIDSEPLILILRSNTLNPILQVKLQKLQDLDLGKCLAGGQLDSFNPTSQMVERGHPAKIKITYAKDMKTIIKFSKDGGSWESFNSKKQIKLQCYGRDLIATISIPHQANVDVKTEPTVYSNGSYESTVATYEINGTCQTYPTSRGQYTGQFYLRVEYE